MSILYKKENITVVPSTVGQLGYPAIPAKPGYYTTIRVSSKELVNGTTSTDPKEQQDREDERTLTDDLANKAFYYPPKEYKAQLKWRIATFQEIEKAVYGTRTTHTKCDVALFIYRKLFTTRRLLSSTYYVDSYSFLALARVGNNLGVMLCLVYPGGTTVPMALREDNPVYNANFDDEDYECNIVNGVEHVSYVGGN